MMDGSALPELPAGWVWTRLGEVLGFIKGKKPKKLSLRSEDLAVPYINIEAFEKNVFEKFTDGKDVPLCDTNDVLIVWDGARCGLVGRGVSGAIGSTLAKLDSYEINSAYLFYFLQTKYGYINKRPRGVGIPHVEPDIFWNIPLPLPPLPEQHRIAARIEELFTSLDAGAEALKKTQAQLKRYRQSVLKHAFEGELTKEWREVHKEELEPASVLLERIKEERKQHAKGKYKELPLVDTSDLLELPEGWVWTRVGEVITPSDEKINPLKMNNMPYIGLEHIEKDTGKLLGYGQSTEVRSLKSRFSKGDMLYGKLRPYLNKVIVVDFDGVCSTDILVFSESRYMSNKYLAYRFLCDDFVRFANINISGVQHPRTNFKVLSQFIIPLPPLPEQHKIVEEIERRFSVADEIGKTVDQSLKQSKRLRQSILKKAFEGKLVPQDPTDEPAELLLERIKAEKAKCEAEEKEKKMKNKKVNTKQTRLMYNGK